MNLYNLSITLLLLIVSFSSCSEQKAINESVEEATITTAIRVEQKQFSTSGFAMGKLEEKTFSNKLTVTGNIHLPEKSKAAVSSLLDGTVGAVDWIEGQWVAKGTTLFTVTNPELINMQAEYLIAQSQLSYLREEYTRQQQLATDNITTKKDLLKAKSEVDATEANYNAVKTKLDLYGISTSQLNTSKLLSAIPVVAPISGYISDIKVLRGSYLEATTTALKISNTNHLYLELSVLEKDGNLLKKGQEITFTTQENPTLIYKATTELVNKNIGENRMLSVLALISQSDVKDLFPGMFANAEILLDNQESLAIPKDALVKKDEKWYMLKLVNRDEAGYEFEQVEVEVGGENEDYVAIKNIKQNDSEYLIKGAYFLIQ